jgi:CheY-like chemotaxis protein
MLLVDADTRSSRRLASMLEEDGWAVELYADGGAAAARLSKPPPPHVIVTDLVLVGQSGLALYAEAQRLMPALPILFLTSYPEHLARVPLEPRPPILSKPVEYATLVEALAGLFDEREATPP